MDNTSESELVKAVDFLCRLRKDYIATVLAARIPGWQNIDAEFETQIAAIRRYESAAAKGVDEDESLASLVDDLKRHKDQAYWERNRLVAILARLYPSGRGITDIPGWDTDWHNCVYIDTPRGQLSWHIHDEEMVQFASLPEYQGEWDGHTTEEKYRRLLVLLLDLEGKRPSLIPAQPVADGGLVARAYNLGWYWGHKAGSTGHDFTERDRQSGAKATLSQLQAELAQERSWRSSDNQSLVKEIDDLREQYEAELDVVKGERDRLREGLEEIARDRGYAPNPVLLINIAKHFLDLLAQPSERQWRTIDSAPKDETALLLWSRHVFIGSFNPYVQREHGRGQWEDEEGATCSPTHWMPLPDSPLALPVQGSVEKDVAEENLKASQSVF